MGHVYKPTYTRAIPDGAEVFTRKGERMARWRDRSGRTRTGRVSADGERVLVRASTWSARYRDGQGRVRTRSTGCRDKSAALAVLADLERRADAVRSGVRSAAADAALDHLATPIETHLRAYIEHLRAKPGKGGRARVNSEHVANVRRRLTSIFADCGWKRLRDANRRDAERWIEQQASAGRWAPRTINAATAALTAFGGWCVQTERLPVSPFARLRKLDESSDRRRTRRALTEDELSRLLYVARLRPLAEHGRGTVRKPSAERMGRRTWTKEAITLDNIEACAARARASLDAERVAALERQGVERSLIYRTLVLTGLRRGELASLRVGSLDLTGATPCVRLRAADSKGGNSADLPLRADLAADLRAWLDERLQARQEAARLRLSDSIPSRLVM